uniref:Forkhead box protein O n=1 Tax=Globodera pallida TaxID=36090 RepID=A0A183CIR3_GLOPA
MEPPNMIIGGDNESGRVGRGGAEAVAQSGELDDSNGDSTTTMANDDEEDDDDNDSFPGDLEPRGRCYTWPVPQFGAVSAPTSAVAAIALQPPPQQQHHHQRHFVGMTCSAASSTPSAISSKFPSLNSIIGGSASSVLTGAEPSTSHPSGSFAAQFGQLDNDSLTLTRPKPKRVRRRTADGAPGCGQQQHSHKKPNPWGEESYSDLIARALSCAIDGRLKLNEVYQWFSDNIPYFAQRSSQEDAQGWKNSIRHNLSLHSRFMRIQNEGAGKSSWWVINPDAKPGRNPRRRANTMEAATKTAIDKKRRGARKRVETLVHQKGTGCSSASMVSIIGTQQSLFPGSDGGSAEQQQQHIVLNAPPTGPNFDTFSPRLSVVGGSLLPRDCRPRSSRPPPLSRPPSTTSPSPPWMEEQQTSSMAGTTATTTNTVVVHQQQQNGGGGNKIQQNSNGGPRCTAASSAMNPQVNELLDRTDQMRLEVVVVEQHNRTMNGVIKMEIGDASQPQSSSTASSTTMLMTKNEICVGAEQPMPSKQEPSPPAIPPPPSYQELSSVRRAAPLQTNPLLRQLGIGGGTPSPPQMKMGPNISSSSMAPCSSSAPPNIFSTSSIVQSSPSFLPTTIGNGCGPYQSMPPGGGVWMPAGPPLVGGQAVAGGQQQQHQMMMMSSSMSPHHHQNNNINLINASGIGQFVVSSPGGVGALPLDLENVNAMSVDQALLSDLDVDAMLRHELELDLAQRGQFDLP